VVALRFLNSNETQDSVLTTPKSLTRSKNEPLLEKGGDFLTPTNHIINRTQVLVKFLSRTQVIIIIKPQNISM